MTSFLHSYTVPQPTTRFELRSAQHTRGVIWRTIDSFELGFCDNCGEKDKSLLHRTSISGYSIWRCEACAEAKRLDDADQARRVALGPPTPEEWEAMKKLSVIVDLDVLLAKVRE